MCPGAHSELSCERWRPLGASSTDPSRAALRGAWGPSVRPLPGYPGGRGAPQAHRAPGQAPCSSAPWSNCCVALPGRHLHPEHTGTNCHGAGHPGITAVAVASTPVVVAHSLLHLSLSTALRCPLAPLYRPDPEARRGQKGPGSARASPERRVPKAEGGPSDLPHPTESTQPAPSSWVLNQEALFTQ